MGAQLFAPDNLSQSEARFVPTTDSHLRAEIESLVELHYRSVVGGVETIELYDGKNVTSLNFKLRSHRGAFLLKRKSSPTDVAGFRREVSQVTFFRNHGMRVSQVFPSSRTNSEVVEYGDACWALFGFENGTYFSGDAEELRSSSEQFVALTRIALENRNTPDVDFNTRESDAFRGELPELVRALEKSNPLPESTFGSNERRLVLEAFRQIQSEDKRWTDSDVPMHLDYHPLNILFEHHEVRLIADFEHFKSVPYTVGLGFAAYKLGREAMVKNHRISTDEAFSKSFVDPWIEAWKNRLASEFGSSPTRADLALGAKYRVLFLIHKIVAGILRHRDERFGYDLRKQVRSLEEIEIFFGADS